jgi:hypothetical protein
MNVEIGTEASQFPEKKYINGIFLAVKQSTKYLENGKPSMYTVQAPGKTLMKQKIR